MFLENNYWFYDRALNPKVCQQIIQYGNSLKENVGVTSDTSEGTEENKQKLAKIRDSRIAWIPQLRWLNIWFWNCAMDANKFADWNFNIDTSEQYQFTKYKEGHFYGWHQDCGPDTIGDGLQRKLSLVCTLTDSSEYEGGQLEICNPQMSPIKKLEDKTDSEEKWFNQGTIIVFPSHMWHQVKKVTKGTRYSLVTWFRGEEFK